MAERYFLSTEILATTASLAVGFQRLVVLHAPDGSAGRIVPLEPATAPLVVGRQVEGLEIGDSALSRAHAAFELRDEGWFVVDHGSRNGTFVEGRRVDEARLDPGQLVRVGQTLLLYEAFRLGDGLELADEEEPLWGPSVALQIARGSLKAAATHDVPVLLLGESGVGKEVAAAYVHACSGRSGALVPVNCGALPANLIEAELFGAKAGAWTGATTDRVGLFEAADGGTIFLDEIGELPLELQPKLLRVLADGEIRRVGDTKPRHVDVRVVAATNRDLEGEVLRERFRGDLLARLAGWKLSLPALRSRREDILALARRLWTGDAPLRLTADAAEALVLYAWPYNVRELRQVCAALAIRAGAGPIGLTALPERIRATLQERVATPTAAAVPLALRIRKDRPPSKADLIAVMDHYGGNVSQVARFFDKARFQVYRWFDKHGVDPEAWRQD